jgi:hypothetical protein
MLEGHTNPATPFFRLHGVPQFLDTTELVTSDGNNLAPSEDDTASEVDVLARDVAQALVFVSDKALHNGSRKAGPQKSSHSSIAHVALEHQRAPSKGDD